MTQLINKPIPLSAPHLTGEEGAFWSQTDPQEYPALVTRFEACLCRSTGAAFALGTHSGTTALELALRALDVGAEDWVICPSLTFGATANAILNVKATPVFVGVEPTAWGLDPDALETALKVLPKPPKAIIAVDLYGMPACWPELQLVVARYGIPLIADSAEAVGASLNGQSWGIWADLNAISFNRNKIITAMGGGGLLTDNASLFRKACIIANQGRQTEWPHEQVSEGGNYRMSPAIAGPGLAQWSLLNKRVEQRRAIFEAYQTALHTSPGVAFQPERVGAFSNRWLTVLTVNAAEAGISSEEVADTLRKAQIETRPVFPPLHLQSMYKGCAYYGNTLAEELARTGLCLPSGSGLSLEQVERVIETFQVALKKTKDVRL